MARVDFSEMDCSVARTLEVIGDRWSLLIIRDGLHGIRRFDDFARELGIARNVLTDRLTKLVGHGVFEKVAYEQRPPRFDYRLTEKGRDLLGIVLTMSAWGDRWASGAPPVRFDHLTCGSRGITPQVTCDVCGEPLTLRDVRADPPRGARAAEGATLDT